MANCFKPEWVIDIEDFNILVRCGADRRDTATIPCRYPALSTAVFRFNVLVDVLF
jgi:hypothetical protein